MLKVHFKLYFWLVSRENDDWFWLVSGRVPDIGPPNL